MSIVTVPRLLMSYLLLRGRLWKENRVEQNPNRTKCVLSAYYISIWSCTGLKQMLESSYVCV